MEKEENDDHGACDGETAGEAAAGASASTAAPALPIAAAAAPPANVTGESLMPSKDAHIHTATVGMLLKRTCVPTASVGTLLQEVQVDMEWVRGA